MGDFNYDALNKDTKAKIIDIENSYQLSQIITQPTRVTLSSSTLLDHVYVSNHLIPSNSGVLASTFSDHFPVYVVIPVSCIPLAHRKVTKRNYNNFNYDNFIRDLVHSEKLSYVLFCKDLDEAWSAFKKEFIHLSNVNAPLQTFTVKSNTCPWITREILDLIYKRDYTHKIALRTNDRESWKHYRSLRNNVTSMIRKAKSSFYTTQIHNATGNAHRMWKILKQTLPSKTSSHRPTEISATDFNDYFSHIGTNLTNDFGELKMPNFETKSPTEKFEFLQINADFVFHELIRLPLHSKQDLLNFDSKLLRLAAPIIAPILTHLFNLSLFHGTLPNDWKLARITPIYKGKGDNTDPSNFRPISIVSTITKIIEKFVKCQLVNYFNLNNLFSPNQFAYLKNHSTQTALHSIIDKCITNIDSGNVNIIAFLDLSKGFDVLNKDILLYKLQKYGIDKTNLAWFNSYLSNRQQYVCNGQDISDFQTINIGVPQGTILGPILFLVYTNDLTNNLENCFSVVYADDTSIGKSGQLASDLEANMNQSLSIASEWFINNRLIVNTNKSNYMIIGSRTKVQSLKDNISISINNNQLQSCDCSKLLGIHIDSHLSFDQHVCYLVSKISPKIGLIHRLRQFLPIKALNQVYLTTIQTLFDYGLTVFGSTSQKNLKLLQRLQNRCARAVTGIFDYTSSVSALIKILGWMNISQRHSYFISCLVFKSLNGNVPVSISNNFSYVRDRHSHSTRNADNSLLTIPRPNSSLYKRSLAYNGAVTWNKLPLTVRSSSSLHSFKHNYKASICS